MFFGHKWLTQVDPAIEYLKFNHMIYHIVKMDSHCFQQTSADSTARLLSGFTVRCLPVNI